MDDVAKTSLDETTNKEEIKEQIKEQIEIPSDEPISKQEEDLLNKRPFVDIVVSLIEANIKAPYSIGIYGDWGSGKTSIMKLIEEEIRRSGEYRIIWFDAWEYENETNLIYPLIRLIQKEVPKDKFEHVRESIGKLTSVILKASCDMFLGRLTAGAVNIKRIEEYEDDYIKKHARMFDTWIDRVAEIKEEFKKLTEAACEPKQGEKDKKKCVVIFIDDLDRCLPENSIKILESIKNIFSKGNCVFILGVDKRTVARVIKGRYPTLTDIECKDYLAKIVPFGLDVPECEVLDFDKYFKFLMYNKLKMDPKTARIDLSFIPNVCVSARLHNPRKIKRSLIAFYLYYKIKQSSGFDYRLNNDIRKVNITDQDILMFCLLYEFWTDLFEKILMSNHLLAELTAVAGSNKFRDWETRFSDEKTYPVLKSFASDQSLYQFLWHWKSPQKGDFVNILIRVSKLIGLKKVPVK